MMISTIARKIFGTQNDRELKSILPIRDRINALEPSIKALSDAQLQAKTGEFRERISKGESLDSLLPEAFAVVREASWRVIGQRHYDVQLIGGITLHRGRIAEMRTGEGKTLVATLPTYLNALAGKGVHVITVNDYLARRDSAWMAKIYGFLGLSTGIIVHGLTDAQRKKNYACDITYGTNNEFGFDYLRDNMKFRLEDYVQRELNFAIVDEVDSILIDEARTPLIISGPTDETTDLYVQIDRHIRAEGGLTKEVDFTVDEKSRTAVLTPEGIDKMERRLKVENLYDGRNIELLHHVNQALRAHVLYLRDDAYVVRDGEVMIVDEFTGRLMPGRRWSDGLHQAIEAKEGVQIENENQTLATITFQNFFKMYSKLGGMTGTADTEAREFKQIYKLDVTVIPTNKSIRRLDHEDVIFKSAQGKFKAALEEIEALHKKGQPVLVGTVSVEKSEMISKMLKERGVRHNVLNAKNHEREAEIVAQAGRKGAVTIATNMAGRGTDILLGGNPENLSRMEVGNLPAEATEEEKAEHLLKQEKALEVWIKQCAAEREEVRSLGGLFILGTERHESRRIDNQLRGRAGRQGDPGESRFYLSFEDDLMRIFGQNEMLKRTVAAMEEDMPIEHKWTTKVIENAQKKVEGHNYDIRKHLLEYDDAMNQQRKVVYAWRREVLSSTELKAMVMDMADDITQEIADDFFPGGKLKRNDQGQVHLDEKALNDAISSTFQTPTSFKEKDIIPFNGEGLKKLIRTHAETWYDQKKKEMGPEMLHQVERMVVLTTIDHLWKDHLLAMDHLREGIGLQGYAQKDPLVQYKKEGFRYFKMMMGQINGDVIRKLYAVKLAPTLEEELKREEESIWNETSTFSPSGDGGNAFESLMQTPAPTPVPASAQKKVQYRIGPNGSLIPVTQDNALVPVAAPQPAVDLMAGRGPRMDMKMNLGPAGTSAGSPARSNEFSSAGRNDPCPCGSGKKFKKCHGVNL